MSVVLQSHVEERLCSDEMVWLSTVRPDGRPHSIPVWFLWESATLLIFSQPNTQKIRNLRKNPSVTLALDDTKKGVVILEGKAELLGQGDASATLQNKKRKSPADFIPGMKRFLQHTTRLFRSLVMGLTQSYRCAILLNRKNVL